MIDLMVRQTVLSIRLRRLIAAIVNDSCGLLKSINNIDARVASPSSMFTSNQRTVRPYTWISGGDRCRFRENICTDGWVSFDKFDQVGLVFVVPASGRFISTMTTRTFVGAIDASPTRNNTLWCVRQSSKWTNKWPRTPVRDIISWTVVILIVLVDWTNRATGGRMAHPLKRKRRNDGRTHAPSITQIVSVARRLY